jgi:twinkle protein
MDPVSASPTNGSATRQDDPNNLPVHEGRMTFQEIGFDFPADATGEIRVPCPKCSHERRKPGEKCCAVNVDSGQWYCHHCGYRGTLGKGIQDKGDPKAWKKTDWASPPILPTTPIPPNVFKWFADRGISEGVVTRNGIAYGDAYMPQVEAWVSCIQFPYKLDGKVVNVKFRDGKKRFRQVTGAQKIPFGMDDVKDAPVVVWVEGEMDKLAIEQAGCLAVLSVPDGAPPPDAKSYATKFDFLETVADRLVGKKHVIAVDTDAPGRKLEAELSRRLGRESCFRVVWPEGCKDANDTLLAHGPGKIAELIENAEEYPVTGVYRIADFAQATEDLWEHGQPGGAKTGWKNVDELYTVRPGEWTLVTGIPGHGKSSWVDALIVNLADKLGWSIAVFSPENQPIQGHVAKLCEIKTNRPFRDGPTLRMDKEQVRETLVWLNGHFVFLLPPEEELTVDHILDKARVAVRRHGIQGLVLDPWNELDHSRPAGLTETEYISASLTKIRRFARSHGVHVWLVAHPQKLQRDKAGKRPVPAPYDVSGSAHWYNKADNCVTVYRDVQDGSKDVEIHVQKIRFREVGKPGLAILKFDRVTGRYFTH